MKWLTVFSVGNAALELSKKSVQSISEAAELVIQQHYCKLLRESGIGVCELFHPPNLGGARSEFFDEDAGLTRCAHFASYIKFHNAHVNEQTIADTCTASHPKPLKVKIPDIISHRFNRVEFYEIKPNSASGTRDGADKIAWANVLCNVANLPYKPGRQYKPNNVHLPINLGNLLGAPLKLNIRIHWATDGLILWDLRPEVGRPQQEEKCGALIRATSQLVAMRIRADAASVAVAWEGLIAGAESPLQGAVAYQQGTPNIFEDVMYVQLMLNDWRGRSGFPLIGEDGIMGNETSDAIFDFQEIVTGITDRRIDPYGAAIRSLEMEHLRSVLYGVEAAIAEYPLPTANDPVIYHDIEQESEDESDWEEPITPIEFAEAMAEEMRTYFSLLY